MAKRLISGKSRLIIYDPMRQFSDCGVVIDNRQALLLFLQSNVKKKFRVIYQPHIGLSDQDVIHNEFKEICRVVNCLRDIYFLVDEIDNCLSQNHHENGYFRNIIQRGRHDRISVVATTIRYTDVQRALTAQADMIICFHTHEPSDVQYFKSYFGDMARELPTLLPFHYLKYEKGVVTKHEPIC